ncbi:putative ABC transport system ATP-binding protein [Faecalicatena contorta]|uniref:Putative ABC transport system ATP-binding protein n=2 Tax=Faecalicatena contorta TaxID=39482 RepID=A0A315ZT62_9FIRM|nr:putative ABC transport system ATP-binding protein [Faecalicatena contorta]SUQ15595.1 putative ABC transport system ATP-binding protein [Faecalicatena contorta]
MADIRFENVRKEYQMGEVVIRAADDVSFRVKNGEFCILLGPSGAGKTTVLNLLGGMDTATSGKIFFGGKDITVMDDLELTDYRRHQIGFVFQFYNLIPNLTAKENVELAKQVCKSPLEPDEALQIVGLKDRVHNFPAQLSGGEQQRVAIARAICKNPDLLLCDEPTGALDTETGKTVLGVLSDISRKMGKTVIIVTHNSLLAPIADRLIEMKNGSVIREMEQENSADLEGIKW